MERRFKDLVTLKCKELEIEALDIEYGEDYVYLYLNCPPVLSPSEVMNHLKGYTGGKLREEFKELSKMQNLWTRNYLVSTEETLDTEIIKKYVELQKKRY